MGGLLLIYRWLGAVIELKEVQNLYTVPWLLLVMFFNQNWSFIFVTYVKLVLIEEYYQKHIGIAYELRLLKNPLVCVLLMTANIEVHVIFLNLIFLLVATVSTTVWLDQLMKMFCFWKSQMKVFMLILGTQKTFNSWL